MKKITIGLTAVFIFSALVTVNCGEEQRPQVETPRWGTAKSGLRLRDKPTTKDSKVIGLIPYGERVDLLEETGNEMKIDGANGKWSKVKWLNKTGYAFGGFLSGNKPVALPAKPKPKKKEGTVYDMQAGDIACYIFFAPPETAGDRDVFYGTFELCDQKDTFIGEPVIARLSKSNVLSPECEGDMSCEKSIEVDLITEMQTSIKAD